MMVSKSAQIWNISKDEWRYWWRSKIAISALIIGLVLTVSSAIVTALNMHEVSHQRADLQSNAENTFAEQPDRHPHRMVHYGHYAFRVPSPLSTIDPGVDAYTGNAIFLEGHRQNSSMFAQMKQGTGLSILGGLSPAFVVQVLAPLLLIIIGYSAISREREAHTFDFILAQGTPIYTFILGKACALLLVVALIILPLCISGIMAVLEGESIVAAISFLLAYFAYLCIWVAIVLVVSLSFAKNSASFTALAFVWVLLCIAMPRIASTTASTVESIPGKLETDFAVIAQLRKLGDGHNASDPAFNKLKENLLKQYAVDTVDQLPINFRGAVASASETELTKVLNEFAEQRMEKERSQTLIARSFGWLSPMVAIRSASMISAGTSIETQHRFLREAEALRYGFVQSLNKAHVEQLDYTDDINRNKGEEAWQKARVSAENWQMIKDFDFSSDSAITRLQRGKIAFLQLLVWFVGLPLLMLWLGKKTI